MTTHTIELRDVTDYDSEVTEDVGNRIFRMCKSDIDLIVKALSEYPGINAHNVEIIDSLANTLQEAKHIIIVY
jgi:hypothetical protein